MYSCTCASVHAGCSDARWVGAYLDDSPYAATASSYGSCDADTCACASTSTSADDDDAPLAHDHTTTPPAANECQRQSKSAAHDTGATATPTCASTACIRY